MAGWLSETARGAVLSVRAQPRSSQPGLDGLLGDDAVKVRVRSAPEGGRANRELAEVLAAAFGIPRGGVVLLGGGSSRHKRLLLRGVTAAAARRVVEGAAGPTAAVRPG